MCDHWRARKLEVAVNYSSRVYSGDDGCDDGESVCGHGRGDGGNGHGQNGDHGSAACVRAAAGPGDCAVEHRSFLLQPINLTCYNSKVPEEDGLISFV
jgi:hypothetical protein